MADVAPLSPLRYAPNRLAQVVAPPYDVISEAERKALEARDPNNVVHLILPQPAAGAGDLSKYEEAGKTLRSWIDGRVLVRDDVPGFYRYDQTFAPPGGGERVTRTGFLGLVRLQPFSDRVILPHERTLSGPKEDRLRLFRATRTNLSPGFMLYRDPTRALDSALASGEEIARFVSQAATEPSPIDNVLTKISNKDAVHAIVEHIAKRQLLIADGHHRYETALHYSREIEANKPTSPRAEHKWFMVFFANEDDPNLLVFPTHRLVHGLSGFSFDALIEKLRDAFEVRDVTGDPVAALQHAGTKGPSLVAADRHRTVLLTQRPDFDAAKHPTLGERPKALRGTDVAILHAVVIEHALGISQDAQAKQTNLSYLKDANDALRRVRGGEGDVLFLMNATPVAQVRAVAEEGEVMPQKSTYFFPKVLTGLTIHTLDPEREVK
ncbi:MAG: DUF1015 domain-containing protein [Polyangiales bacterium]